MISLIIIYAISTLILLLIIFFPISLKLWLEHDSIATCRTMHTEPIDLDYCLRAFTSEERLEERYHCSNCNDKQPATKKLQIWRLPPILVS